MNGKVTAIVLSAGTGKRMNSAIPKQYLNLSGKPVIVWSIEAFQKCALIDYIILVTGENDIPFCKSEIVGRYGLDKVTGVVAGGRERSDSVLRGLLACPADTDYVLIHDGARPLVDEDVIRRTVEGAKEYRAAVAGIAAKDTIKIVNEEGYVETTPDRSRLRTIQTPQAFEYKLIRKAYEKVASDGIFVTDDAMAVEYAGNVRVKIVEGAVRNIKITTREDLETAAALLKTD